MEQILILIVVSMAAVFIKTQPEPLIYEFLALTWIIYIDFS